MVNNLVNENFERLQFLDFIFEHIFTKFSENSQLH